MLVERLWPRGMKKEDAQIDVWLKEAAPSPDLRKWFNHDPSKWEEFKKRYSEELDHHKDILVTLFRRTQKETVTFVFASKEERFNNAVVLKEYLEQWP